MVIMIKTKLIFSFGRYMSILIYLIVLQLRLRYLQLHVNFVYSNCFVLFFYFEGHT